MKKYIFALAIPLLFWASLNAQGIQFVQGSLKSLLEQAKKEKKLVFIDCYTTWCGPCKWMDANTFKEEKAGSFFPDHFVAAKFDMEKGEGLTIAKTYEVTAYPTYLILDPTGKQVHRGIGSMPVEDFMILVSRGTNPETQLATLQARYDGGERDTAFLGKFISTLNSAGYDASQATDEYLNALGKDNVISKAGWRMISDNISTLESKWVQLVDLQFDNFAKLSSPDKVNNWLNYVVQNSIRMSAQDGVDGLENFKQLMHKYLPRSGAQHDLAADYYFRESLPMEESHPFAKAYFDEFCMSYSELNSIAWTYFENAGDTEMLKDALAWARRSVGIKAVSYNVDTEANLLAKLEMWKEAETAAKRSIELATQNGEDAESTQELLDEIQQHLN